MALQDMTPAELLRAIHEGSAAAEAVLVRTYSHSVFYVLKRRCNNAELARDLCQDTFLVLLEKFRTQSIDDPERLSAYIHKTAINLLIAQQRKDARRQTRTDNDLVDACIDARSNPLQEVERMQITEAVKDSILGMDNPRDKEILYRYYIREHDKGDICLQLGIDFRHFDKVIFRAKSRLKDILQQSAGKECFDVDR